MTPDGLSVVTATRGRRDLLLEKVHALAAQDLDPERFEWIVAFDGPDPDAEADLRAATPGALRLTTVTTPGVGAGPARDAAAARARFGVLYLSDDDCLPDPRTLSRHLAAQADPAVYVGEVAFETPGEAADPPIRRAHGRAGWWNVGGANTSVPRAAFEAVGGFGDAVAGYGGEDLWLGWRLRAHGLRVRRLDGAAVLHRGPDPELGKDPDRARSAGANAVRLARLEPALAWRLGVHPALRGLKGALFATRLASVVWPDARRRAYERHYVQGASRAAAAPGATAAAGPTDGKDPR